MISRPLAVALLAAGCLTAAAAGSYVAGRQSAAPAVATQPAAPAAPVAPVQPVTETETVVEPARPVAPSTVAPEAPAIEAPAVSRPRTTAPARRAAPAVARQTPPPSRDPGYRPASQRPVDPVEQPRPVAQPAASVETATSAPVEAERNERPARVTVPQFEEIVIPAATVVGLEIASAISSETAHVEDRVDGRVTRDVYADGRVAIPAGSRMLGTVTLVERGGKIKERARLGIRFHTLVLADGRQVDLRTDTIYREGDSVSSESSKKIGGAAIGGAVLGAIMGGGKGAVLGGAAGAGAGTAVVMAGGRNPATLPGGTVVTARVSTPASIEVEKR